MARRGQTWVGTSGWQYDHWVGPVYQPALDSGARLAHYARFLDSVEVNSTFYGLPSTAVVEHWRDVTPADFIFAVKASRYITHMKKLKDPGASTARFFEAVEPLGHKLGPILFQLPPRWRVNPRRLEDFLAALPAGPRYAFEFRDESWHCQEVSDLLARHNAAFCIFDLEGQQTPIEITADFAYIRLHGPDGAYRGSYGQATLKSWAARIAEWRDSGLDCYCYFDNDEAGYAFANAGRLREMLSRP
jgi:uncharacterized protein YecE (DUF72 family)